MFGVFIVLFVIDTLIISILLAVHLGTFDRSDRYPVGLSIGTNGLVEIGFSILQVGGLAGSELAGSSAVCDVALLLKLSAAHRIYCRDGRSPPPPVHRSKLLAVSGSALLM